MMTMRASVARHMAAGVEGLDELERLVAADIGRVPSRDVLRTTKRHVKDLPKYREANREACARWYAANPDESRKKAREAQARWRLENPEKRREVQARWYVANPAKKLLNACRGSAKTRGHDCSITAADIEALLAPMVCSVTGLPLTLTHDGDSKTNPWAPSIDRLDNSIGYVPGNVRVVCWAFNMMRADWSDSVVMAVVKALAARTL